MELESLAPAHPAIRRHPELGLLMAGMAIRTDGPLGLPFTVSGPGQVTFGAPALPSGAEALFHLRHGLELGWLSGLCAAPVAGLAAARCAALAIGLETASDGGVSLPAWIAPLAGQSAPDLSLCRLIWTRLSAHQPAAAAEVLERADHERLSEAWPLIGPTEWLMEQGGDIRLGNNPITGLNGYGCSHRPRPWAITFASSTASSCSERGFRGAEEARRRMVGGALQSDRRKAVAAETAAIRRGIAGFYGLPPGAGVVLAASGTDCELIALALAQAVEPLAVTNILIAPEETGSGVPLAAVGRHFAVDAAAGAMVPKGEPIAGFLSETSLVSIPVRSADGGPRSAAEVDADCVAAVEAAITAGRRPLLHVLDVSKTGLRAPSLACAEALVARFAGALDIVVDACQARLADGAVRGFLERGWMVLVTGSKFFTGPPFAGAVLAPGIVLKRLDGATLPRGLVDYSDALEWPEGLSAAAALGGAGNHGLCLRWHAALAEMEAYAAVPPAARKALLHRFIRHVEGAIAEHSELQAVRLQPDAVSVSEWTETDTIRCFAMRRPSESGFLDLAEARRVYHWLNADLGEALPESLIRGPAERAALQRRCHIGQPVAIGIGGEPAAVLRVSAGARLVSGEPSMAPLSPAARMDRETADVTALFLKLVLILRHYDCLAVANPQPTFS
jgi:hypothetical protein